MDEIEKIDLENLDEGVIDDTNGVKLLDVARNNVYLLAEKINEIIDKLNQLDKADLEKRIDGLEKIITKI